MTDSIFQNCLLATASIFPYVLLTIWVQHYPHWKMGLSFFSLNLEMTLCYFWGLIIEGNVAFVNPATMLWESLGNPMERPRLSVLVTVGNPSWSPWKHQHQLPDKQVNLQIIPQPSHWFTSSLWDFLARLHTLWYRDKMIPLYPLQIPYSQNHKYNKWLLFYAISLRKFAIW